MAMKNDIKKAVIKKDRLTVNFNERFIEDNYTNTVTKACDQIIHNDLKEAFEKLKVHLVALCEMPEAESINENSIKSPGFYLTFQNYAIEGYSYSSQNGVRGITIHGKKLLQNGNTLELSIWTSIDDTYQYFDELSIDIEACDYEVHEYLFNEKWGIKQQMLDFETDEPADNADVSAKKEKRIKKKRVALPASFDAFA